MIGTSDWLGALVSHMGRTFFGGVRVNAIIEWVRSWNVPRGGASAGRHGVRWRAGRELKARREKGKAELVLEAIVDRWGAT